MYCYGMNGPAISDYNKQLILLSVIQLSGVTVYTNFHLYQAFSVMKGFVYYHLHHLKTVKNVSETLKWWEMMWWSYMIWEVPFCVPLSIKCCCLNSSKHFHFPQLFYQPGIWNLGFSSFKKKNMTSGKKPSLSNIGLRL